MSLHPHRDELLAGFVLCDLSEAELSQLDASDAREISEFDVTAALLAAELAVNHEQTNEQTLPPELITRTKAAVRGLSSNTDSSHALESASTPSTPASSPVEPKKHPIPWMAASGWLTAAACILVAVNLVQFRGQQGLSPTQSASEQLASLLSNPTTQTADWTPWVPILDGDTGDPMPYASVVSGRVVWNQELQQGFMVFAGMPQNTAASEQFQLWIVDSAQSYPVDGGVFDISADGEVLVPIDPAIEIGNPIAFGITVEPPGGVVVSNRSKRVVAARL